MNFFQRLPHFSVFNELVESRHFTKVPEDWFVVVADVEGSTAAIESGRYKDVNTIGAACIVAAQNAMDKTDFPYTFGGDGATLLIPPEAIDSVASALNAVKVLAKEKFSLYLRLGKVAVSELYGEGCVLEVAKYQLVPSRSVALFRGGGVSKAMAQLRGGGASVAEEKIRKRPDRYRLSDGEVPNLSLKGLSCRWQPVPSKRGKTLTLMVRAHSQDSAATYRKILDRLDKIFDGNLRAANPIHVDNMSYKRLWAILNEENRLHASPFSRAFIARAIDILLCVIIFKLKFPSIFFDAQKYADSMASHSDFLKFSDILRMVVDCSPVQVDEIQSYFKGLRESGEIAFGTTVAEDALMTCFVYGTGEGEHIHFVDGGGGGYAEAAKQFKMQIENSS